MSVRPGSKDDHVATLESGSEYEDSIRSDSSEAQPNEIAEFMNQQDEDDLLQPLSQTDLTGEAVEQSNPLRRPTLVKGTDRLVPEISDNPYASEPTYFTRPNRYFGPRSTWFFWTAQDRLVAEALDRIRAQDLSIHLFNAFALRRNYKPLKNTKHQFKGKRRSTSEEPYLSDLKVALISKHWAAWPMHPDIVPSGIVDDSEDKRPSAQLEDCLVATTTRIARERWHRRDWMPEPSPKRDILVHHGDPGRDNDPVELTQTEEIIIQTEDRSDADSSSRTSDLDQPLFTSQNYDMEVDVREMPQNRTNDLQENSRLDENRPTILADDESARDLLVPSMRHILTKVDDLLLGLHKARQAYAVVQLEDASEGTDTSTDRLGRRSISRGRSTTREVVREGGLIRSSTSVASTPSNVSRSRRQNPSLRFGQRNWSDVIGMASLTGWDNSVIERASERCALLFGENMTFRTFHEGQGVGKEAQRYTEQFALEEEYSSDSEDSETQLDAMSQVLSLSEQKTCPYQSCERYSIPFKKSWHLKRHINSVHANDHLSSSPSKPRSSDVDLSGSYQCPVLDCPKNEKGYTKSTRLYQHIREHHPSIDVNQFKKLELQRRRASQTRKTARKRGRPSSHQRPSSRASVGDYMADLDNESE